MASFPTRAVASFAFAVSFAALSGCGGGPKKPAASASSSESSGNSGPAEVGKPAPDLSVQTVNGKGKVTLESLQGKVVIVDFWATWCAPCKQSFPKLEELSKQNPDKVQIVGIAVDDQIDGVADFAKQNGATFAIGWDDGHSIANRWKVDTMPTSYVLDATGKVRFIHAGYHDDEAQKLAKEVASLASEAPGGGSPSAVAKSDTPPSSDSKPEAKASSDSKPEAKGDGDGDGDAEPPPPKKTGKGGKKGGGKKGGGKKAPKKK